MRFKKLRKVLSKNSMVRINLGVSHRDHVSCSMVPSRFDSCLVTNVEARMYPIMMRPMISVNLEWPKKEDVKAMKTRKIKGPKFKKLRKIVSRTDTISIMITSTGDVYDNYHCISDVPEIFNECRVIGFGQIDAVSVDGYDILMKGTEFYLDDSGITLPNNEKESDDKKDGK